MISDNDKSRATQVPNEIMITDRFRKQINKIFVY